jgi:hypothetical protein
MSGFSKFNASRYGLEMRFGEQLDALCKYLGANVRQTNRDFTMRLC